MIVFAVWAPRVAAESGVSANAPGVVSYVGLTEACCGPDPHPVHGIGSADGGYVVVGKSADSEETWGGFALKLSPQLPQASGVFLEPAESDAVAWVVQLGGESGKSALLNAASNEEAVFLAGLHSASGGSAEMYLAKHDLAEGQRIWEQGFMTSGGAGAIEAIHITPEGGLIACGTAQAPPGGLEGFKSFGNPFGGQAQVFYLSPEQVEADTPPASPAWSRSFSAYETAKAVRPLPGQGAGFIVLVGREDAPPTLLHLDASGELVWERAYPGRFEATDVALHVVEGEHLGYTFTGHGGEKGALDGQLTRVDLDGEVMWTAAFGDPAGGVGPFAGLGNGEPSLIFDECWGIQGLPDGGSVVGCGTGIEGCEGLNDSGLSSQCAQDPRRTWRGYVVRFDAEGEILWQRVDSFAEEGADDEVPDSASEYVALLPGGALLSVVDQGFGLGLLILEPEEGAGEAPRTREQEPEPNAEAADEGEGDDDEQRDKPEVERDDEAELDGDVERDDEADLEDAPIDEAHQGGGCVGAQGEGSVTFALLLLSLFALRRPKGLGLARS